MKTREEYRAIAAVMGMGFSNDTHAFYPEDVNGSQYYGASVVWLDADTLEELDWDRRVRRRAKYNALRQDGATAEKIIAHFRMKGM